MKNLTDKEAEQFLTETIAFAKSKGRLKELARFVSYFAAGQQLADMTGSNKKTLQTLVMLSPANARLRGIQFSE